MSTDPQDFSGADSDERLIYLWLHGHLPSTVKTYRADAVAFLKAMPRPLRQVTLMDVATWIDTLQGADSYQARRLISIKSLLTFAYDVGYCKFNVSKAVRLRRTKNRVHERIIEFETVQSMTAKAAEGRDRTLLRLLYGSACRVSEAVGLNFGDLNPVSTEEGYGVVTFHGKGSKTRRVLVSLVVIDELLALRQDGDDKGAVFRNFNDGGRLTARSAQRIVAKSRTDVAGVTPHWMRHAHATHALDNGAPLHFVKDTLGHSNISTTDIYVHVRGKQGSAPFVHPT